MRLSKALVKKRIELGKKQSEISDLIGISRPLYAMLENAKYPNNIKPLTIGKLARWLEVDPQEIRLMFREDL